MKTVIVERSKSVEHIVGTEFKSYYRESDHELALAEKEITRIHDEYEGYLNENGHELDDQDKMNDMEATINLIPGIYEFDCGDFIYYIHISED
ncbi:TPA: hypothetical protein N6134_005042 [Escherichia coli]|nr:hypothetical protein [Escherichia coli]